MTYASFSDPGGNTWLLQEIKTRLDGRGISSPDVATLTELLRRPRRTTANTNRRRRSTTGPGGTPPSSPRASAGEKTPEEAAKEASIEGAREPAQA